MRRLETLEWMSRKGEAVIARSRSCGLRLFRQAAGGGVITAFTAIGKYWISLVLGSWGHGLLETLCMSANYMGSFVLMQALGFKLATKLPSLTAAALARRFGLKRLPGLGCWTRELGWIGQTQLAATLGNLTAVVPTAIVFQFLFRVCAGHPVLSSETSLHVIHSLNPYLPSTLAYAALTGVLLWLASWLAGVYHSANPLGASRWLGDNTSNLSLGALLGMVPLLGRILALPLDVRHLTLSSGALTFALCSLGWQNAMRVGGAQALLGLVFIGVLNFGVSFLISFTLGLSSRQFAVQEAVQAI